MNGTQGWFERIFVKLAVVLIMMGMAIPFVLHIGNVDFSFLQLHTIAAGHVRYWHAPDANTASFTHVLGAPEKDFSAVQPVPGWERRYIWVRLQLPEGERGEMVRLYTAHEYWRIHSAYASVQGIWQALRVQNDDIYSSAAVPASVPGNSYMYIQLSGDSIGNALLFRISREDDFTRLQNWLFAFRMFNVSLLMGLLALNLILAFYSRHCEYSVHVLLMMASINMLLQLSGIPQLLWGQTNVYAGCFWGFMTCLMGMFFQYKYFGIMHLPLWLVRAYRGMLGGMLVLTFFIGIVQTPGIVVPLHIGVMGICTIGLVTVLYAYWRQHTPIHFIVGTMLMFLGIYLYVMGCFGILPWNHVTANLIYPALTGESILFTAGIVQQIRQRRHVIQQLKKEADTDRLTTLYNRNYFDTVSMLQIEQHEANNLPVAVVMADIDRFKAVNDTYGHNAGDVLLREVADILKRCVRKEDDAIRWGGEEFLIILYTADIESALLLAEMIRKTIETYAFTCGIAVTISLGIAAKNKNETMEDCVGRADKKLYEAKAAGRNRICW